MVSALYFECDQGEFPLACPFTHGKENLWAGMAFLGGIALTFWGVRAFVSGMIDKSRVSNAMKGGNAAVTVAF
ncbi:hypothetical protein D3C83_199290 [compost metagenome]